MSRFRAPALMLLGIALHAHAQAIPKWTLPAQPIVQIGVTEGDTHQELANVSSAHRLPDGRIVIANGKPLELRLFDSKGKFLHTIGHAGAGPGEFQYSVSVYPGPGDSIMAYTSGTRRWEWFTPDGKLVREVPSGTDRPYPVELSMYKNSFWVRRTTPFACVRGLIDRLPPLTGDTLREIFADGTGRYWVRPVGSSEWTVFNGATKAIGRVAVPDRFEILEAVGPSLVGKVRDEDDVERVVAWRLGGWTQTPLPAQPCMQVADSLVPQIFGVKAARLRTDLRNYMTAAHAFFSDNHRYPRTAAEMPQSYFNLSPGSDMRILVSNTRGYVVLLKDHETPLHCLIAVGEGVIAGFPSGTITCSQ